MAYRLTREALALDLHSAFQCAKRRKSGKTYIKAFTKNLDENIGMLADELAERRYVPEPSSCFIIEEPKKREVFAAQFRDRIVHHLYYNYTHELFERTFIADCYACIEGRGTHYGIKRLKKHILAESENYTKRCWVMKLDVRGYFMHIDRRRLLDIAMKTLRRYGSDAKCGIDMDFVEWLTTEIALIDPAKNCKKIGDESDWEGLDHNKSLFNTDYGCGLPIGNLTSQLFSNVYMNVFDQYMKRELKCKHYGRYVDDAFVVSRDRQWLWSLVPMVRTFLKERLGLELHEGKLYVTDVKHGVEFLGAFIKPHRTYIANTSLKRTIRKVRQLDVCDRDKVWTSVNSMLGTMSHFNSYHIRANMFLTPKLLSVSNYNRDITKMSVIHQ